MPYSTVNPMFAMMFPQGWDPFGPMLQKHFQKSDMPQWQQYLSDIQNDPNNVFAPPRFRSDLFNQMSQQVMGGMLPGMLPQSPMQQAELENVRAKTGYYNAQAQASNAPQPQAGPVFQGPGGALMQQDRFGNISTVYKPNEPTYDIIEPIGGGQQQYHIKGSSLPEGFKVVRSPISETTINMAAASPTERAAMAETAQGLDTLENLKMLFDNPKTRTGPIAGRYDPIAGLVGATSSEQEALMAATSAFKNRIIKEITGAQMSEVEARRIMKQIPDITDPPVRWQAKYEQTKRNLEAIQRRRQEVMRKSGVNAPELEGSSPLKAATNRQGLPSGVSQAQDGKFWRMGDGVWENPTSQDLRDIGTEQAFNQGKELGYW